MSETRGRVLQRVGFILWRLTWMSQKTLERLERLRKLNSDKRWINHDLHRLMYKEDLYILAYERIKSKPGNMTPGSDGETLDGFSLKAIQEIIHEMKAEQFSFKPVRNTYIPKANGKLRKLGIPSVRDKIVQEVMHMILEAIYDSPHGPYFMETSHGFRPHRSCHTALREFREKWTAVNWLIEGDIRACFDELAHHRLVAILRKKIQDERFLNLIWKLLNAGYMDLHGERKDSLIGSPQGGIISPILANVYLHELDEFVEQLRERLEKGKEKRRNPTYERLRNKRHSMVKHGRACTKEFREITRQMRAIPSKQVNDPQYIRIRYLRYADDWLIGVYGSHSLATEIKQDIKTFLHDQLQLTLNEEKTHITNARTEEGFFLGTILKIGNGGNAKIKLQTSSVTGKTFKRRSTGMETAMNAPLPKLVKRLAERGFCTKEGKPAPKTGWMFLDADQIVSLYSSVNRGLQNFYRFVDNWAHMQRIQYILQYSLAKALARKYRISMTKVFKRFGKTLTIVVPGKNGKKDRKVSFYLNPDWNKKRGAFQRGKQPTIDLVQTTIRMKTRSKLGKVCCICENVEQIEMHHVRHIRKLSHKREATGFNCLLRAINRKQIPVCITCHRKIHQGKYDSLKLSELAYIPR